MSYNLPKSTLSTILKNKDKIRESFAASKIEPRRKCIRHSSHEDLEKALLLWFRQARAMNVPISGPI